MYPINVMPSLKALRKIASLSQAELGDLVGVRYQLVSDWERGVYTPKPSNIRKLCRALKCRREDLEFSVRDPMDLLHGMACLPSDDRQIAMEGRSDRIKELEKQVKDGTTLLEKIVLHMDAQEEYIENLENIIREAGLSDRLPP